MIPGSELSKGTFARFFTRFACCPMTTSSGYSLLHDPTRSKSTAFTREERERFGLRGLLPHKVSVLADQCDRVMENLRRKHYDIERTQKRVFQPD